MKALIQSFAAVSPLAEQLFNQLMGKSPDFGLGIWELPLPQGGFESINMDERALLGALNLILNREGTTDAWLESSLSTTLPITVSMEHATSINRFLIKHDVIEKHSSKEPALIDNRLVQVKIWKLTQDWRIMVTMAKAQEVEKVRIRELGQAPDLNQIKGLSKSSGCIKRALGKLDSTRFQFHSNTMRLAKSYAKTIKDDRAEVELAKGRELEAVVSEFESRGTEPFQLTHTADFRARMYARGGMISTQASKLQKAAIRFADPEDTVDVDELLVYVGRLLGCKGTFLEALEVGRNAPADSLEAQAVLTDPNHAIIRLDGCSNGIQWMSAFLNDPVGMELTNLTGSEVRDLYSLVKYELHMDDRDAAKGFVMPYSYGATANTLAKNLGESVADIFKMIDRLNTILPIKRYLSHVKREERFARKGMYSWRLPDGFKVVQSYTKFETVNAGTFSAKIDGSAKVNMDKMSGALAPNIIHSIDAYHARLIINGCDFPVVPIHDSFGCHSSNVSEMRKVIKSTFKQVLREDVLNKIMRDLQFDGFGDKPKANLITNPYMFM